MISTTTTTRQRHSFFLHSPPTCQSEKEEALYAKTKLQKCSSSSSRTRNPKERERWWWWERDFDWRLFLTRLFLTLFLSTSSFYINFWAHKQTEEKESRTFLGRGLALSLTCSHTKRRRESFDRIRHYALSLISNVIILLLLAAERVYSIT